MDEYGVLVRFQEISETCCFQDATVDIYILNIYNIYLMRSRKPGDEHSLLLKISIEELAILDEKAKALGLDRSSFLRFVIRTADVSGVTTRLVVPKSKEDER